MRAETGVMKFGDDWSGIFIRGDNAFMYAAVLEKIPIAEMNPIQAAALRSLHELFLSCLESKTDERRAHLRPYEECRSGD